MAVVSGIDLSNTSTGLVVLGKERWIIEATSICFERQMKGKDWKKLLKFFPAEQARAFEFARYLFYCREIIKKLMQWNVQYVAIESYAYAGHKMYLSTESGGLLKYLLLQKNIPWIEVAPSSLKKFATGKGKGEKSDIVLAVYKKWGFDPSEYGVPSGKEREDTADAFVLAQVAYSIINESIDDLTKPQQEVVEHYSEKAAREFKAPYEKKGKKKGKKNKKKS